MQQLVFYLAISIILAASSQFGEWFLRPIFPWARWVYGGGRNVSAILSLRGWPFGASWDVLNFIVDLLIGGLCAAMAGFLVGMPSLRLRGDYLAIVTLGFGEIIRVIILNLEIVGGARGLYGIPGDTGPMACFQTYIWVGVTLVLLWRLVHSSYGRAFLSVREDEIAARCMGGLTPRSSKSQLLSFRVSSLVRPVPFLPVPPMH